VEVSSADYGGCIIERERMNENRVSNRNGTDRLMEMSILLIDVQHILYKGGHFILCIERYSARERNSIKIIREYEFTGAL
jgi:hypothetical protein